MQFLLELCLRIDSIYGIVPFVLTVTGYSWRACQNREAGMVSFFEPDLDRDSLVDNFHTLVPPVRATTMDRPPNLAYLLNDPMAYARS